MPKQSLTLNGFGGGLNLDSSHSDIISNGEGEDECVSCKNFTLEDRGKITGNVFTISTGNPSDGVDAANNTSADKAIMVYRDNSGNLVSKWHQNTGIYAVDEKINYMAKSDYISHAPTQGSLNPANMGSQKDGVDISLLNDRSRDTIIFLGGQAANNQEAKGMIGNMNYLDIDQAPNHLAGDESESGISDFINTKFDLGPNGRAGEDVDYFTDTSESECELIRTAAAGANDGVTIKNVSGNYMDFTGTNSDFDFSTVNTIGIWNGSDTTRGVFIAFRVGRMEVNGSSDMRQGLYGTTMPTMENRDIVIELKANGANWNAGFDGIYIGLDCNEQNSEFWYNEEDPHGKIWKITESQITAAGCTSDFARIVIPHETAIHVGNKYSHGDVRQLTVGFATEGTSTVDTTQPKFEIREIAFVPNDITYEWSLNDTKLSQSLIKNEIESLPTRYDGIYQKNTSSAKLVVQRPDETHGPLSGNIYYETLDDAGVSTTDKLLLATWDKTKGVKKVDSDSYTAWSSNVYTDLVQNGTDFASNWTVRSAEDAGASDGDGWTLTGGKYVCDNDEEASIIGALASSMKAGQKYQLQFDIDDADINLTIGGGDASGVSNGSGNVAQETLVPAALYGADTTNVVEFTVGSTDRSHLWIFVDDDATGSGAGKVDNVSLYAMPQVEISFDNPPLGSTYTLESGFPDGTETINTLFKCSAVIGRQVYIGNVAEEINHETLDTSSISLDFQSASTSKMRRGSGNWETQGFTASTGYVVIQDATDATNNVLHTAGAFSDGAGTKDDWAMAVAFAANRTESANQVKITQFGEFDGSKILKSAFGKNAGFSNIEYIDLDFGGGIIQAMESSGDRLFVFSAHQLAIINVAQDIEFLEAQLPNMGVDGHRCVAKVGEGLAWVNDNGVHLFDGEQVKTISDEKMRTAGLANQAIVYWPKDKLIIAWKDTNEAYAYSLITKTWVSHMPTLANVPETNSVPLADGSTVFYEDGGSVKYIGRVSSTSQDMELKTGRLSMGNIAQNKKFHKVIIRGKELDGLRLMYTTDKVSSSTLIGSCTSNTTDTSIGEDVFKLSGVIGKWIQITVEDTSNNGNSNAEINDISVIYRNKALK
tara:strand:+ start:5348 stop:8665 length:3318 start_codon:yes stop_codon:yes gene_type:complete